MVNNIRKYIYIQRNLPYFEVSGTSKKIFITVVKLPVTETSK